MGLTQAADLQRADPTNAVLYEQVVARTAMGEGKLEGVAAFRCMSGQRAKATGGPEQIYSTRHLGKVSKKPTEREEGSWSDPSTSHSDVVAALPATFETRECGMTLEMEPICGENITR
jgi:hypothetical protein